MRIQVRDRELGLARGGRERIERSIGFALGRFGRRIRRVTVGLTDLNGPRGGVDKRCHVEVTLEPRGTVFIEEDGADIHATVDSAAGRLARAVERKLDRDRDPDVGWARQGRGLGGRSAGTRPIEERVRKAPWLIDGHD